MYTKLRKNRFSGVNQMKMGNRGFTVIEMLVVFAILAILAMLIIPRLVGHIELAQEATDQANCRTMYSVYALDLYNANGEDVDVPTLEGSVIEATHLETEILTFQCTFGSKTYAAPFTSD